MARAFLVGAIFSLIIGYLSPYTVMNIQSMGMSADFITAGAIICLFLIVGALSPVLRGLRHPFRREELILIYAMMIAASAVPSWGFMLNLVPVIAGLYYFASPENEWAELIHPYLRDFLVPQDKRAITTFFEGAYNTSYVPWKPWVTPFLTWFAFMIVLYFVMVCLMVILRRQWIEHEKLTFPLTVLPLEMTTRSFFRTKLMWAGFAIPFLLLSLNALHNYNPMVPAMNLRKWFNLYGGSTYLIIDVSFSILGFAYLVNLDVSLSLWLFHLLSRLETVLFSMFNYYIPGGTPAQSGSSPMTTHQGMGGMIALVLLVFWAARRHLGSIFRDAWKGTRGDEVFSYRFALTGIVVGTILLSGWLWVSGLPWWLIPLFLFGAFVVFVGLTRIVAEGGVGFTRAQCIPQPFVMFGVGSRPIGAQGLVALGLTYTWVSDVRTIVMTSVLHGFKMGDVAGVSRKRIVQGAFLAVVLAFVISYITIIYSSYQYGALNAQKTWFFQSLPVVVAREITNPMQHPIDSDAIIPRWTFTGIGAGVMFLLVFLRHRFLWFPLHYLGFPVNDTWIIANAWFSIFLGWLFKLAILRWGGLRAYANMKPLFLGFILGTITCAGMWLIIDAITGMKGNMVPIGVA